MDCINAKKMINEHSEENSHPDQQTLLKEHLRSCRDCAAYAADIKKTIETLHDLDEIDPPAWLTAKVMKRVSAEARPGKRWIERLFFPLHVKLPLEAFAAILITVAALFIYKNMGPELRQMEIQPQAPAIRNVPAEPEKVIPKQEIQKKEIPQPLRKEEMRKDSAAATETRKIMSLREEKPVEQHAPVVAPTMPAPSSSFAPSPALSPAMRHAETGKASGMAARDEGMQKAAPAAPASEFLAAKKAVSLPTLTLTVKALDTAVTEIETYIIKNKGAVKTIEQSATRIVMTVTLDPTRTGTFIEQISTLGTIKEDRQTLLNQSSSFKLIIEKQ